MLLKPPTCNGCPLRDISIGFMARPETTAELGVVFVGEALGEEEAASGEPFVGPAGQLLNNAMTRAGLDRSKIPILNAVWCQPPQNQLSGKPYFIPATTHCRHFHLDPELRRLKPKVIVALGGIAMHSLIGESGIEEARGYPVWSSKYNCWVLPTLHPSFIRRGQYPKEAFLIHDMQRAVDIAQNGWAFKWGDYLLDPTPQEALEWARTQLALYPDAEISADIETAGKSGKEDDLDLADGSYAITRISFSLADYTGMSIPWASPYMPAIRLLLENDRDKIWWNKSYDVPRIRYNGVKIGGRQIDGMIAWHVLHTDLPKDLGSVTTILSPEQPRWKNMAQSRPAFYNAVDSDVARRNTMRAFKALKEAGLWPLYLRHILRVGEISDKMSERGMPIDAERRLAAAKTLQGKRAATDSELERVVPVEIRAKFVYANPPREAEREAAGLIRVGSREVPVCIHCGYERPPKTHFGKPTPKFPARHGKAGDTVIKDVGQWARLEPLKVSWQLILRYQEYKHHPKVMRGKGEDRKATTDENALRQMLLKYPDDEFYKLVIQERKLKTLQGRYIGYLEVDEQGVERVRQGIVVGPDGLVHTTFNDNPSTLRWGSENPNMQNLPRTTNELTSLVKGMFVAPEGYTFIARDYASIESLLVGWLSGSKTYYRVSRIDAHTFVTLWVLYELEKRIPFADVPQLEWSDADLREYLGKMKGKFKHERQGVKHMGHATNYMSGAKRTQELLFDELEVMVPIREIKRFREFYLESLFPEIGRWHSDLAVAVDGTRPRSPMVGQPTGAGYVRNAFGLKHNFYEVIQWTKVHGKWEWSFGEPAKSLIAFGPQSNASGIGKEALIRIEENRPEIADGLRLFIHDELLGMWPVDRTEEVLYKMKVEMEQPNPQFPLDPEWGMGEYMVVQTEGKVGRVWGEMKEVKD